MNICYILSTINYYIVILFFLAIDLLGLTFFSDYFYIFVLFIDSIINYFSYFSHFILLFE